MCIKGTVFSNVVSSVMLHVVCCGTLQAALGTNPLTLAAPGKQDTFELDMATSAVAIGKVMTGTFLPFSLL